MEPSVLAGPIEFSPAEIALFVAVLAAIFIAVTAPGWALVGFAAQRRRKAHRPGPAWGAALVGAVGGLVVCFAVASFAGALLSSVGFLGAVLGVAASWAACWAIAYAIMPRPATGATDAPSPTYPTSSGPSSEGWGR